MDAAALAFAARIVLAAVLLVAAAAKLRDRDATRERAVALLGDRAGKAAAASLPGAEAVVALALVVWWSPVPGVVAALMLGAFTAVLVRAQVRHVPCPCFGGVGGDAPPGPGAVMRNAFLIVCAVLSTASPAGASAPAAVIWVGVLGLGAGLAVRAGG